jgi:hypothetical protein
VAASEPSGSCVNPAKMQQAPERRAPSGALSASRCPRAEPRRLDPLSALQDARASVTNVSAARTSSVAALAVKITSAV